MKFDIFHAAYAYDSAREQSSIFTCFCNHELLLRHKNQHHIVGKYKFSIHWALERKGSFAASSSNLGVFEVAHAYANFCGFFIAPMAPIRLSCLYKTFTSLWSRCHGPDLNALPELNSS